MGFTSILGAFALSVGTSIGWGSFVVTGSDYLSEAGLLGSIIGIVLGTILMAIIAYNYHYMINKVPDSGGIYSFVKYAINSDHAFLASWFLIIVYTSILWANVTSVALFSRFLIGDFFQYGKLYTIAGYDVYIGEILLCSVVLFLIGALTLLNKKITTSITFGLVSIFIIAVVFVSAYSLIHTPDFSISSVAYVSDTNHFGQIMRVLAMTPWAFIGFEGISQNTGSFSFNTKKVFKVLLASLLASALVYILLCQVSIMAHPEIYSSWYEYIAHNTEVGIMGIPPFYVAYYYLGNTGVTIFGIALFAIIATSIIGNIYALSNLIQRMAEDGIFPKKFAYVNKNDIPVYVQLFIIIITFFAMFIGRSAIGYIVDVNNIGGVIVYAYVSICALLIGLRKSEIAAKICGILGLIASLIFGISHLAPIFTTAESIARETFVVFIAFSLLGFAFFAWTLKRDTKGNFGNSSIVWVGLSVMIAFFSGAWVIERSKGIHGGLLDTIKNYYANTDPTLIDPAYLDYLEGQADYQNMIGMGVLFAVIAITLLLLFVTLYLIKEKERRHKRQLDTMIDVANKDPLTGVNNHRAYINNEKRLTAELSNNPEHKYALVVCDVNDLKYVNDKYGHDYGDEYLCKACNIITDVYQNSKVFRIGGDEFVVLLEEEYENRETLLKQIKDITLANINSDDGIVIAVGMATNENHKNFNDVFHEADRLMYKNKKELKIKRPSHNLR